MPSSVKVSDEWPSPRATAGRKRAGGRGVPRGPHREGGPGEQRATRGMEGGAPQGSSCHVRFQSGVAARRGSQTCPKALLSCSPTPGQDVTHSVLTTKPIRVRICLGKSPFVQRLLQNLPCKRHQTETWLGVPSRGHAAPEPAPRSLNAVHTHCGTELVASSAGNEVTSKK